MGLGGFKKGLWTVAVSLPLSLSLSLSLAPLNAKADEGAAWKAFSDKNYRQSFQSFLPLAASGEPYAQFVLGWMFETGNGATKDPGVAAKWYRAAAEQGVVGAQFNLGLFYDGGNGVVAKDLSQAVRWYRLAANQGDSKAQHNLGNMLVKGEGGKRNFDEGIDMLSQAADGGDPLAMGYLGVLRLDPKIPGADGAEAWKYLDAAAKLGNKSAGLLAVVLDGQLKPEDKKYAQAVQAYWSASNNLTLPNRR